jgi:P pilus assembly chaperone PapD
MKPEFFSAAALAGLLLSTVVQAVPAVQGNSGGLSLSQTRVIFDANEPGVTVSLHNKGERPWLVRARVLIAPDSMATAPFTVTPPLFRLEPNSRNTVRIMRQGGQDLPADRESVFYLSFLAIPSSQRLDEDVSTGVAAQVTVGMDTVIKLFYRPSGIAMAPQVAAGKLIVRRTEQAITVDNPTPYYQTLSSLSLDGKPVDVRAQGSMIAPFGSQRYTVSGQPSEAVWTVINDYGGISPTFRAAITDGKGA